VVIRTPRKTARKIRALLIITISIPQSTSNIQLHPFKTTFYILSTLPTYKHITSKQHSCVQGPLRECLRARRFRATLLLHLRQRSANTCGAGFAFLLFFLASTNTKLASSTTVTIATRRSHRAMILSKIESEYPR